MQHLAKAATPMTVLALVLAAGCGRSPAPEAPAALEAPLLGAVRYGSDCTATDRAFLDKAMHYGRTAAVSNAFAQCMDSAVRGGTYMQCSGDPLYGSDTASQLSAVMTASRSSVDVTINCTGGSGNASSGIGAYGQLTPEALSFSGWLRAVDAAPSGAGPWPWSQAAGIIWHEAMHQQGYTHGGNDQASAKPACGTPRSLTRSGTFRSTPCPTSSRTAWRRSSTARAPRAVHRSRAAMA